eukprot:Tbor_TRINITY_DN5277_c0_g1::TRINITY_DN5277_c0_g1_i1::g.16408::m.16408
MLQNSQTPYLTRSYLREREARFALEHFFVVREEYHRRRGLKLKEEHDVSELFAMFLYSMQEIMLHIRHQRDLEGLYKRLQEQHHTFLRTWDIEHITHSAEHEAHVLNARRHEVASNMKERDEKLQAAERQWFKTSADMDIQIEILRKDLANAMTMNKQHDTELINNTMLDNSVKLKRHGERVIKYLEPLPYRRQRLADDDMHTAVERTNLLLARANKVLTSDRSMDSYDSHQRSM